MTAQAELDSKRREEVHDLLQKIDSADGVFGLFRHFGYPQNFMFDTSSVRKKENFGFRIDDHEKIKRVYSVLSIDEKMSVFLLETETLNHSFIRSVASTFDKSYSNFLLIFTTDYSEIAFIFPNHEKIEAGKHKLKLTKLTVKKNEIHYTDAQTLASIYYEGETSWMNLWIKWKKAFSVERVTEDFFEEFEDVFFTLRQELNRQKIPKKESHEFTLQFLNRIMFIYFISKKKWLEHTKFIEWLWTSYKKTGKYRHDEFYGIWLKQIFLKAFNNRSNEIAGLPENVTQVLSSSPFLNGGLFKKNELDDLKVKISDSMFQTVFEFFQRYNFTIKEDMPLDEEVAVDPQMIGYIYESLANVAEQIYDKNDLGIFYTPRVEVDFMCRRSLVEYLSKQLPDVPKENFYYLVFGNEEEKERSHVFFDKGKLWSKLEEVLENLSVVDPACGSGAFLVGMLNVLTEIYRVIYKKICRTISDFDMKFRIVQRSLYGVDVMPWAIHASELRLWLQLIVETEFKKERLKEHPLLPNLNLNLRVGDSLVQEIGGISFNIRTNSLNPSLKKKLESLKQEKMKYYENSPTAKFKTTDEVKAEEIRLFEEIIDERIESLHTDIERTNGEIRKSKSQKNLSGKIIYDSAVIEGLEEEIRNFLSEIENLKKVKELLKDPEKKPFVWDIDFAEIFGDKNGFDIVIGNPPYVRYQKISPPNKTKAEVNLSQKREYVDKLNKSIQTIFPIQQIINRKSDLYIYFYYHGLSLLNDKGTFCFITSNSWLDVDYGKKFQEFLLKHAPIYAIYDNLKKKSFAHADVYTIITLLGAPHFNEKKLAGLKIVSKDEYPSFNHKAKFIMFKKPFEQVVNTENLIEIENQNTLIKNDNFRMFPISQKNLYESGFDKYYTGTMWGGRYLRSPDIFIDIQANCKNKLLRLNKIVDVETYLNTLGSDDFFFVSILESGNRLSKISSRIDNKSFIVENEFLTDLIESPREIKSILIKGNFKTKLFRKPLEEYCKMKKTKAYEYIEFGRKKGFNIELPKQAYDGKKIIMACYQGANHIIHYNPKGIISHRFFRIIPKNEKINMKKLVLLLNSTFNSLSMEIFRNPSLGGGVLAHGTYTIKEFLIIDPEKIKIDENHFESFFDREIKTIFEECGIVPNKSIREQEPKPLPDRAELDKIIFDELGLTEEERKEVYWSVCELVKQRLEKAGSLKKD